MILLLISNVSFIAMIIFIHKLDNPQHRTIQAYLRVKKVIISLHLTRKDQGNSGLLCTRYNSFTIAMVSIFDRHKSKLHRALPLFVGTVGFTSASISSVAQKKFIVHSKQFQLSGFVYSTVSNPCCIYLHTVVYTLLHPPCDSTEYPPHRHSFIIHLNMQCSVNQ